MRCIGALVAIFLVLPGCDSHTAAAPAGGSGSGRTGKSEAERDVDPSSVTRGERFTCTPEKVWDGDGPIHCAEGPKVRLAGIAAREADGLCRPGHPCPDSTAQAAQEALAGLLGETVGTSATGHLLVEGPPLECRSEGSAKGSRTAAWCISPAVGDISCAMVASGTVAKWERYWRGHSCGQAADFAQRTPAERSRRLRAR